jgi:transposase, IS30 family
MEDATAAAALAGFTVKLNSIAAPMSQSLTYDQGKEMARHAELAANTGVRVYFCDPHSPWQRGACKSTNSLLRQYLPKGLSVYTQEELDAIADSTHDWRTPLEVFAQMLASSHKSSTSVH